jgi:hypothetical protein
MPPAAAGRRLAPDDAVMWELIPLALLSAVYPTLIAVVIVALTAPRPARAMAFFLLGGMISSVGVGLFLVLQFQGSSLVNGSSPPANPTVYFAVGALALVLAVFVRRRPPAQPKGDGRLTRILEHSQKAVVAFGVGLLLDLVPGAWYVVALKDIAQAGYSDTQIVLVIVAFCIVQYALIELPLLGFLVAPERAADLSKRFSVWLTANTQTLAVAVLIVGGAYMMVRGIASVT